MHSSTVLFVAIFGIGFFHLFQASPIGHVGFTSVEVATTKSALATTTTTSESVISTTEKELPRPILNETAVTVIDTLTDISSSNETHIRQKRSCGCCGGGCGCCCCHAAVVVANHVAAAASLAVVVANVVVVDAVVAGKLSEIKNDF
uniref:Hepcidin n=1 Tax=Panagrolaimus sp. ES5 TaxID=591445 RepID=A0AC34FF18_9BILA